MLFLQIEVTVQPAMAQECVAKFMKVAYMGEWIVVTRILHTMDHNYYHNIDIWLNY